MRLWLDRLKVVLRTLAYREAWRFRPRQSLGMLRYLLNARPTWRDDEAEMNVYSPPVGSAAYSRYLQGLRRIDRGQWAPLVVHVSVTDRCPHRCARCSNIAQGDVDPPRETLVGPSLLGEGRLEQFVAFCEELGVHEVMLLEEVPVRGGPANGDVGALRQRLTAMQLRSARNAALPKVSSMSWLESPDCLGCQAGFSFLYVTARGAVFPCDFVPISFGNVHELGIEAIHQRMQRVLRRPSSACLASRLTKLYGGTAEWPQSWEAAQAILRDDDPGPAPRLLRYLGHGCQHSP